MHARSVILAIFASLMVVVGGCATFQKGETVVKYDRGSAPIMGEAPSDGQYSLYKVVDATPMVTYQLKTGEKLGFEKPEGGKLSAVAGTHKLELSDESGYYWKRR